MSASSSRAPAALAASALPLTIAFAGMAALASAMGIGRFAFTPLLPMMLHDGVVDLPQGSWLATANYLGYLLGALLYMVLPRLLGRAAGAHGLGVAAARCTGRTAGGTRGGASAGALRARGREALSQVDGTRLRRGRRLDHVGRHVLQRGNGYLLRPGASGAGQQHGTCQGRDLPGL